MQSVPDFMQEFLRAEHESRRRSIELEKDLWARFGVDGFCFSETVRNEATYEIGELEGFEETGQTVTATATSWHPSYDLARTRFGLVEVKGGWRINAVGYHCITCKGTGKAARPASPGDLGVCSICEGQGYFVPRELKPPKYRKTDSSPRSAKPDIDHFMHQFLVAERALHTRLVEVANEMWASFAVPHFRPPHLALLQKKWDEQTMVQTFRETGEGATVVATTVRSWQSPGRVRYTMARRDRAWWISGMERACGNCNGHGTYLVEQEGETKEMVCLVCRGKAWFPS